MYYAIYHYLEHWGILLSSYFFHAMCERVYEGNLEGLLLKYWTVDKLEYLSEFLLLKYR